MGIQQLCNSRCHNYCDYNDTEDYYGDYKYDKDDDYGDYKYDKDDDFCDYHG